ncbi:MAG: tungstate ABC transporter substrate-binding protein WtpA [Alphaproteobacteria bacterium]
MRKFFISIFLFSVFLFLATSGMAKSKKEIFSGDLVIFHAGSLSVPFREISMAFQEKHPRVSVKAEAAGSRDTARKISDLGRQADIVAVADKKVVENLLMPEHADFNLSFATNEMAIAYTKHSRFAKKVNVENWAKILMHKKVAFGRADPNRDPCGYRTEMIFQLAEKHFHEKGLAKKLQKKHGKKYIRPKETDLLALLEMGEIDYLFIYRSVAEQHGLKFITLPDTLNLRAPSKSALYRTAKVEVTGKKPGSFLTRKGAPIVYSITMPKNAAHPALGEAYLKFLFSPKGQKILKRNGHGVLSPVRAEGYKNVPVSLKRFSEREK